LRRILIPLHSIRASQAERSTGEWMKEEMKDIWFPAKKIWFWLGAPNSLKISPVDYKPIRYAVEKNSRRRRIKAIRAVQPIIQWMSLISLT